MIYEEYEAIWSKIRKIEKELFDLINKRDELFDMTQPKSSKFDKEIVDGKNPINSMEQYIIQKEYMNEKIAQLNQTLDDRYQILRRKRDELKYSRDTYDRIYYYRLIEKLSPEKIAYLIPCDRATVYRYMKNMCKNVKGLNYELYSIRSHKQNK
jgi:uncharacterized coiled-coil DUF342 family protein